MILNENSLKYKVVDLDEIYNFHIKFIFIRVYKKKLRFYLRWTRRSLDCHQQSMHPVTQIQKASRTVFLGYKHTVQRNTQTSDAFWVASHGEGKSMLSLSSDIFQSSMVGPSSQAQPVAAASQFCVSLGGSQFWVSDPSIVRDSYDEMGLLFRLVLLEIALLPFEMAGREVLPPC
jgi:hypothetical protein